MFAALTGLGLSTAAGFNAYIPLLVVGLASNFTDKLALPSAYTWMSEWWFIALLTVLLIVEVVVDKVPLVDHINDVVQTAIRPASGGAVFSATTAAAEVDNSAWLAEHPWVGWLVGILSALGVHGVKALVRPVVNASTAGFGAPVVSTVEDGGSLGISLVAVFLPILVIVALVLLIWLGFILVRKIRRRRARRRDANAATIAT